MNPTRKSLAVIPAAILVIALAIPMPGFANAQGSCTVTGTGTAYGPDTETFTSTGTVFSNSTNSTNPVVITYTVDDGCLDKGANVGDSVSAAFDISATCNDNGTGACAGLATLGSIGTYSAAEKTCNKNGTCSVGAVTPGSGDIPANGTDVQILSGSANMTALPNHGRTVVAHLGEVSIVVPSGFSQVDSPDFSIAFQGPRP